MPRLQLRHHHPARASTRSLLALLASLTIALTLLGLAGEGLLPD